MEKTVRNTTIEVIERMIGDLYLPRFPRILEPSAGKGALIDGIFERFPGAFVECCELNKEMREYLIEAGYDVIGEDFMQLKSDNVYDAVIAAPPFKDNVDVIHIRRMYQFLKPGGVIVSLTHPAWTIRNGAHQKKFREWLSDKKYVMRMLPDMSFVENYETQPTAVITITKPL